MTHYIGLDAHSKTCTAVVTDKSRKKCFRNPNFLLRKNTCEKLAAITPPPKSHLVRWGGVFAANSPFRKKIILKPEEKKGFDFQDSEKKRVNKSWSLMLARVFKLDVLKCDCGNGMVLPVYTTGFIEP